MLRVLRVPLIAVIAKCYECYEPLSKRTHSTLLAGRANASSPPSQSAPVIRVSRSIRNPPALGRLDASWNPSIAGDGRTTKITTSGRRRNAESGETPMNMRLSSDRNVPFHTGVYEFFGEMDGRKP